MASSSHYVHEFFKENPNTIFELVHVLDIDLQEKPYYFQAVFENIKTKWKETVQISPELLRTKYRPGNRYKNGKRVFQNSHIKKATIPITVKDDDALVELSSIFDTNELIKEKKPYYNNFLLKQYAYKIEMDDYILVVPCSAIAIRYYFLSSSMTQAVIAGSLESLCYHDDAVLEDGVVAIDLKGKAGKKDIPYICRFATNKYAEFRLKYFATQRSYNMRYTHIKAMFPVSGTYKITALYQEINIDRYNKPIYFVKSITNDTSPFEFTKILYKKYAKGSNPKGTDYTERRMPAKRKYTKRLPLEAGETISFATPSNEYDERVLYELAERDLNTIGLVIEGQKEYLGLSDTVKKLELSEGGSNISFGEGQSDGDDDTAPARYVEVDENPNKSIFTLEQFIEYYDELMEYMGVEEIQPLEVHKINKIKNTKQNSYNAKSIIKPAHTRHFLFGVFAYDNKCVYVVEVEHDYSWAPSTWLYISNDLSDTLDVSVMQEILEKSIESGLSYPEISKISFDEHKLCFEKKVHRTGDDSSIIENWCDGVLEKVLKVQVVSNE